MAKNAIPRTWTLVIGEDSRRYSDAPNDLIPPSAPIISLTATLTDTSIGVKVSTPSVDTRHVVLSYVFEYNTGSGPFTALTPVGAAVAEVELLIENLQPSTTYFIRARGIDSSIALNQSANSNTISATTDAPAAPGATFWPNWPIMNAQTLQGSNLLNLTNTPVDVLADKDVVIFQSFFPTEARVGPRSAAIDDVHADQSAPQVTRFFLYYLMESTDKVDTSTPGNNAREITRTVITSATDGNPNWFLHRAGLPTSVVEMSFDPTNIRACNMAVLDSGLNSFGENYAEAYWRVWKASWDALPSGPAFKAKLAGVFVDNFNQRGQQNTINNGATPVNDIDFDGDGDVDARGDYSAGDNAGGRMIAEGHLEVKSVIESTYPGYIVIPNAARWDSDYTSGDGLGIPPLPISLAPFFRNFEIILNEHTGNDLSLFTSGTTSYNSLSTAGSTGRIQAYFKAYHIMEKYLKLDATLPAGIGRGCVLQHANALNRAPQANDLAFIRFLSLLPLLVERAAVCVQGGGIRAVSLDETIVDLGAPDILRSMGTLSETTLAFTIRPADFSSGVARVWWARFANGIVVVRGDAPTPGTYPSADAAVSIPLPAAGVGKKWQRLGIIYTNPVTGRSTRNQDPTLNNGADVTSVSLKPFHATLVLRVNS